MTSGKDMDRHDLTDLVDRYYVMLYRFAYRLSGSAADAEDIIQQTFLTACIKLDQLRDRNSAKSWLFTIALNTYRKGIRDNTGGEVSLEVVSEPLQPDPRDIELDSEELQQVLQELPEEYRTPLILFYFQEFSYKEIAGQLDVPMGTVMSRLARAKGFLRRRLASSSASSSGSGGLRMESVSSSSRMK